MKFLKKIFFVMAVIAMTAFIGCEKENVEPNEEEVVDPDLDNNNDDNNNNDNSVITALGEISASVENGGTLDNIIDYVKASVEGSEYSIFQQKRMNITDVLLPAVTLPLPLITLHQELNQWLPFWKRSNKTPY